MTDFKIWLAGLLLVVAWIGLGTTFDAWAYKLPIAPSFVSGALYAFPVFAGFIVAHQCSSHPGSKAVLLILPVVLLVPTANYAMGKLGAGTDLPGLEGAKVAFWLSLVSGLMTILPGAIAGLVMRALSH